LKKDSDDSDRVLSTVDSVSGGDDAAEHGAEGGAVHGGAVVGPAKTAVDSMTIG
jgi:hypothetical protein